MALVSFPVSLSPGYSHGFVLAPLPTACSTDSHTPAHRDGVLLGRQVDLVLVLGQHLGVAGCPLAGGEASGETLLILAMEATEPGPSRRGCVAVKSEGILFWG